MEQLERAENWERERDVKKYGGAEAGGRGAVSWGYRRWCER